MIQKLYDECDEILVMEEGYPIVEELLKGLLATGKPIHGRLDGTLPRDGELNPNIAAKAVGRPFETGASIPELVQARPPKLCDGCPHWDSFRALNEAMSSTATTGVPRLPIISCPRCFRLNPKDRAAPKSSLWL